MFATEFEVSGCQVSYQIGLVSFGTNLCGRGIPGVYTKVAAYLPWIESKMEVWSESYLDIKQWNFLDKKINIFQSMKNLYKHIYVDNVSKFHDKYKNKWNYVSNHDHDNTFTFYISNWLKTTKHIVHTYASLVAY